MLATSTHMLATATTPSTPPLQHTNPVKSTNPVRSAPTSNTPSSNIPTSKSGFLKQAHQPVQNRVKMLLVHIPKLSIRGQARLAAEVGVSRSTISRLVNGRINPSYRLARGVTTALERLLGYPLDMRDVFTTDGTYLTPSGCGLCRCGGCLPDEAYDAEGNMGAEWLGQRPGDWSMTPAAGTVLVHSVPDGNGKEDR